MQSMSTITTADLATYNWVVIPAPFTAGQVPSTTDSNSWQVVLTGIAVINFPGQNTNWFRDTVQLDLNPIPNDLTSNPTGLLGMALHAAGFPNYSSVLQDQFAVYAALNAASFAQVGAPSGVALDAASVYFATADVLDNGTENATATVVQGLNFNVAALLQGASLIRIGFQLTLVGHVVQYTNLL